MKVIFDTSVYVDYLRSGKLAHIVEGRAGQAVVHLSAVVAQELLVGAPDRKAVRFLEGLVNRFNAMGRLVVPEIQDWMRAGSAIRQVAQRHGFEQVRRARLTNDALILASGLRLGATILTRNADDFALLRGHLPAAVVGL